MLLGAAQIYRLVVAVLDMEADGVFVEFAAGVQIRHVEHGVAGADDVERRIEDVLRNGHVVSLVGFVIPGWSEAQTRNLSTPIVITDLGSLARPGMTVI